MTRISIEESGWDGGSCPTCGSPYTRAEHFDEDASGRKVRCRECDAQWWEVWELIGYEIVPN